MRQRYAVIMMVVAMVAMVMTALGGLAGRPAVAAEPGVTDTEILLGGSNSFSGPLAFTGTQLTKFGVDLYFRVLNDAGGVHGRKLRTVYYDDGYRPQDAVANTKKLVEQDTAVIAPQGTPVVATLILSTEQGPAALPFRARRCVATGMFRMTPTTGVEDDGSTTRSAGSSSGSPRSTRTTSTASPS
jgi:hypothetical protein